MKRFVAICVAAVLTLAALVASRVATYTVWRDAQTARERMAVQESLVALYQRHVDEASFSPEEKERLAALRRAMAEVSRRAELLSPDEVQFWVVVGAASLCLFGFFMHMLLGYVRPRNRQPVP